MVFQLLRHFWAYQRISWKVTLVIDALGLGKGECPFGWVSNTYSLQSVICVLVASWVSTMIRYVLCPFCHVSLLVCLDLRRLSMVVLDTPFPLYHPEIWSIWFWEALIIEKKSNMSGQVGHIFHSTNFWNMFF